MDFIVADIKAIFERILSQKLIKKNEKYGNSVYDEEGGFFNDLDIEDRIGTRLDDKLRRLKTLDKTTLKYDSELEEIVAYLLLLINYRTRHTLKEGISVGYAQEDAESDEIITVKLNNKVNFYDTIIPAVEKYGTLKHAYKQWYPVNFECEYDERGLCTVCGNCMEMGSQKRVMKGVKK